MSSPSYADILKSKAAVVPAAPTSPTGRVLTPIRKPVRIPLITAMPGPRLATPGHRGTAGITNPALRSKPTVGHPALGSGSVPAGAQKKSATPQATEVGSAKKAAIGATKKTEIIKNHIKNGEEKKREVKRVRALNPESLDEGDQWRYEQFLGKAGLTKAEVDRQKAWLQKEKEEEMKRIEARQIAKYRAENPVPRVVKEDQRKPDLETRNYQHELLMKKVGAARGSCTQTLFLPPTTAPKPSPSLAFSRTEEKLAAARAAAQATIAKSSALLKRLPKARPKAYLRPGEKPAVGSRPVFADRKLEAMRGKGLAERTMKKFDGPVAASGVQKRALPPPVASRPAPVPAVSGSSVHTTMPARAGEDRATVAGKRLPAPLAKSVAHTTISARNGEDRATVAGTKKAVAASAPAAGSGRGAVPSTSIRPQPPSALAPRSSRVQKPVSTTTTTKSKPALLSAAASISTTTTTTTNSRSSSSNTTTSNTVSVTTATSTTTSKSSISLAEYSARLAAKKRRMEEEDEDVVAKKARVFGNVDGNVKRLGVSTPSLSSVAPAACVGGKALKRRREESEEERDAKRARPEARK